MVEPRGPFVEIERKLGRLGDLLSNTESILKKIGALGVKSAQRAFRDQKFGGVSWPARYEGMEPPFINIAGALADFESGRARPKPNRFQDRPALIDEGFRGGLLASISWQLSGKDAVEWGSTKPYAETHQLGLPSTTRISVAGKRRVQEWLFQKRAPFAPRAGREGYVDKLWPPAVRGEHTVNTAARPFIGITDELESEIIQTIERFGEVKA